MTVQNVWPLTLLILIPVIILLYLLKQKVRDESFSSILLWQEIYKNLEAKTPFEKLKQNILMYLQILLMLLLILALMAPALKKGGTAQENMVLVVDTSASMEYQYDNQDTRLTYSIKEAQKEIDALSEDTIVTLISCGGEASVVYQGKDKTTLKTRLSSLETELEAGNLNQAANVVNSVIADMENVQVICYTDTDFASREFTKNNKKATLLVKDVYSKGENCSLDYVNYSAEEDTVEALCKVTNYGETEVTQDVSLYADSDILNLQSVTVKPGESVTVYFEPLKLPLDGSVVLRAELSGKDSLLADNSQSIVVSAVAEKRVLLLSEGNVFLEKALSLDDMVTVYKSDNVGVLNQMEDSYDLYVFDGVSLPNDFDVSRLPEDTGFLFLNYNKDFYEKHYMEADSEITDAVLLFSDSPVTQYIEDYAFGITRAFTYTLPDWAIPFLKTENGEVCGYYGMAKRHNIGVLGFDIHNTDFALQTEFPIFMSQLCDVLLGTKGDTAEITNFPVSEESDVTPVDSVIVRGSQNKKKTGGRAIRNFLLAVVILLLIVEWIVYIRQVNSSKKKQFLVVRCLLLLVVILAMTGVSVTKKQKKTETIFLVDVSDSMSGNLEELEEYLKKMVNEMPEKNLCSVVAFGKDTAVDQFLSDKKIFSKFTVHPVTTATNIEKAVQSASSMFDEGVSKRLVLITDGSENEGNMSLSATMLKGNEVELYAVCMEDSIGTNSEVYIDDLSAPNVIHVGDHYNITVSVTSNVETDALLSLYAGRSMKGQQEIHLNKGSNQFVFEDIGGEGTFAQYKAVIEPQEDTISVNNTYATFADIEAKPRVLLVEGKAEEGNEFEKILAAANIDYDKVTPKGAPITVSELNQYKAVITLDVYYDDLREGFVKSLEAYVKEFAGGYICIGGDNSYALGNYRDTVLEDILPVNVDLQGEKEIPKMAMAMVIDQSGSMCSPSEENTSVTGLDLAKQAAISGVSELRNSDEVGVLAFDDTYHWIVPIAQLSDAERVKDEIGTIAYGGGTSIYPAFQEACNQIVKSDAKIKHIILLTDGQDAFNQYGTLFNLINETGITVSTVAVGKEADQRTLSNIAEQCGGRYYYTDVNNSIPRIFAQEVYLSTNTYLINEEFYPTITSNNDIIKGVFDEGCPALYGYIAATPKQTTDVILESQKGDPILSTWQCGLGRTVAWNSDGTNEWTAEYAAWDNYPTLWSNIINYVISDTGLGEDNLEVAKAGNTATISYETKAYNKNTKVAAVVTDENGNTREVSLDAVKPGVFETSLDMDGIGVYSVSVRKMAGTEVEKNYNTAYANQYSAEYQFSDSEIDFASFVKQAGGKGITLEDNIWKENQNAVKARVPLTIPLLILAVFLLLFDIVIRRFSLDILSYLKRAWNVAAGWLGRRFVFLQGMFATKHQKRRKDVQGNTAREVSGDDGENTSRAEDRMQPDIKGKESRQRKEKKTEKEKDAAAASLDMNQLLKKKQERE